MDAFCIGENKIKLKLRVSKIEKTKNNTRNQIRFVVIDLDRSKKYPENLVCILPKTIKTKTKSTNKFEKEFGEDSLKIAKQLLQKALRARYNSETKKIIRERLTLLKTRM